MAEQNNRITLLVALITVFGTLGTALIANWDKVFSRSDHAVAAMANAVRGSPSVEKPAEPLAAIDQKPAGAQKIALVATSSTPISDSAVDRDNDDASAPPKRTIPRIGGVWHDVGSATNGARIKQNGHSFEFNRYGVLPNGIAYQSEGAGTMKNRKLNLIYTAAYQTGNASSGQCEGVLSEDAQRIDMSCVDSLLGNFETVSVR